MEALHLPLGLEVLDLACGRGRHARILHRMGHRVTGIDIAPRNIEYCLRHTLPGMQFQVGDIRRLNYSDAFDVVLLLFTSFGYFSDAENTGVLENVHRALRKGGLLLLDFFNARLLAGTDRTESIKIIYGHRYRIVKYATNTHICKDIFVDEDTAFHEKVRLYSAQDLREMLQKSHFEILREWGSYTLDPFDEAASQRYILSARK